MVHVATGELRIDREGGRDGFATDGHCIFPNDQRFSYINIGDTCSSYASLPPDPPHRGVLMKVVTTTLEMLARPQAEPRPFPDDVRLDRAATVSPEYARFLYGLVGGSWYWTERL